ncbi:MAG: MFS transporter [Chloroflexota bacterium]|nr:MFS transporter [Chloroflexota bacterium]
MPSRGEVGGGSVEGRVTTYGALFAVPGFRRVAASGFLVRTAAGMWQLALVLFVIVTLRSPILAGFAVFLSIAPGIVLSPLAGALLDRHGRVRLMALDYAASAVAILAIAGTSLAGVLSAPLLLTIVALSSLTNPIGHAGVRSLFPLLVPRHLWDRANALDSVGYTLSSILGAPLAGVLYAALGPHPTFAITGVLYLAAAVVMLAVRDPQAGVAGRHLLREAGAAVGYVVRHPTLRSLAIGIFTGNLTMGIVVVAVPVLVVQGLDGDAAQVGQLWALLGLAGICAGLLTGRLGTKGRERLIIAAAFGGLGIGAAILGTAGSVQVVALGMIAIGLSLAPMDVALFSLRQRRTDPAWFGRAFAVSMHLNYSGIPVGSAIAGPLVAVSFTLAFGLGVVFALVGALLIYVLVPGEHAAVVSAAGEGLAGS